MSESWIRDPVDGKRIEYEVPFSISWREMRVPLHVGLLLVTLFTTTLAGVEWIGKDPFDLLNFKSGLAYSISLLLILGTHEFGHFFYALKHRVKATLPYFIPFPIIPGLLNFGTFGAVIRTKTPVPSRKAMFDIGVSGPIAGFIVSVAVLVFGFTHLPSKDYLLHIHPNYDFATNTVPGSEGIPLAFGNTILFKLLEIIFTNPHREFVPPMGEIYHYPFLCVGWFGLFVTAMNLLPVGQLDGGHMIYAMFASAHKRIARAFFFVILFLGLLGILPLIPSNVLKGASSINIGWTGWLFWCAILFFLIKLDHPPVADTSPLDTKRKIIGWLTILIFIVSFSPNPFTT
ncbi:MAG TPA: site-2 protease family protein [Candidatus Acidoferrales bacterium]|nr:site-2 protease family protein [Candidatus Acidoferrales bacterium]